MSKTIEGYVKGKKTRITVEIHEVIVIKQGGKGPVWCPVCGETVLALRPEEAAAASGFPIRTIHRWLESETLHFTASDDGSQLICLTSILQISKESLR